MLSFKDVCKEMKPVIDGYCFKYGRGSCQRSFASSFCLKNKYQDKFEEKDAYLFTYRSGISDEKQKTYLFPLGDLENETGIKNAINEILDDAKKDGCKVLFKTIDEAEKNVLEKYFGDKFKIEDARDYYEYIYDAKKISELNGSVFQAKRNAIHKLLRTYSDSITIKKIEDKDISNIEDFYNEWIKDVDEDHKAYIENEIKEFELAIDNYNFLGLLGIVVMIEGKVVGFNFGSKVDEFTYDGIIQKGDTKYNGIYELLNNYTAKIFESEVKYMNFEEDLGIEGLRKAKMMYQPIHLMKKYIAMEV